MFLTRRFYIVMSLLIIVVAVGYALPPLMVVGMVGVALLVAATAVEVAMLYQKRGVEAWRSCDARSSQVRLAPYNQSLEAPVVDTAGVSVYR